jgi:hypothetical protein
VVESFLVWVSKLKVQFGDLSLKITAMISSFGPQNHVSDGLSDGLSVAPQNRREDATSWDTRRDLAACFTRKQVELCFSV